MLKFEQNEREESDNNILKKTNEETQCEEERTIIK